MKKASLGIALALCLSGAVCADQLYVRNRPFQGHAISVGKRLDLILVNLEQLAKAMDYQISEVRGNRVLHPAGQPAELAEEIDTTGKLYVNGKPVTLVVDLGQEMVSLTEVGQLLDARLRHNPSMKTVDFDLPAQGMVRGQAPTGPASAPTAAAGVRDVAGAKYRLIMFGATW